MRITAAAAELDALAARMRAAARNTRKDLELLIDKELYQARRVLRDATPVKTGAMRADWHKERSGLGGKVYNSVPYAVYQFTGTKPHAIPGAFGYPAPFGDSPTFHPGTKANQRLLDAFDNEIAVANTRFEQFGYEVIGRIAGKDVVRVAGE